MPYHLIRAVRVWPIDHSYLPEIYFAMAVLFLILSLLCGVWILRRLS